MNYLSALRSLDEEASEFVDVNVVHTCQAIDDEIDYADLTNTTLDDGTRDFIEVLNTLFTARWR